MKARNLIAALVLTMLLMTTGAALACSAVGPNTHVGMLLGIDEAAQTFTVLDAQTNQPITFLADEAILASVRNAKGRVFVDFEAEGSDLRAISVQ